LKRYLPNSSNRRGICYLIHSDIPDTIKFFNLKSCLVASFISVGIHLRIPEHGIKKAKIAKARVSLWKWRAKNLF